MIETGRRIRSGESAQRLDWVDTGRGVAILLVVLFHSTNWIATTGVDVAIWFDISAVLATLRMPMFFVLAGLFAGKWLTASWGELLRTKVLLFGWVLMIWAAIGMVIQQWGLHAAGKPVNLLAAVRDVLLAPVKPPFELWFIWALAVFFVVAKATRIVPPVIQLVAVGALSAVALTVWFSTTTGLTGGAKYYFFFLAGLYLRAVVLSFASSRVWVRFAVLAGWAIVSTTLFLFDLRALPGVYFLNCIAGVFAGIALSVPLARFGGLSRLGRQTLPIYLAHTPIAILITILVIVAPPLLAVASAVSWAVPPLVAMIAVAGSVGLHRLAARSFLRFLYGPPRLAVRILGGAH